MVMIENPYKCPVLEDQKQVEMVSEQSWQNVEQLSGQESNAEKGILSREKDKHQGSEHDTACGQGTAGVLGRLAQGRSSE